MLTIFDGMKKMLALGSVALFLMLGACNTVEGFGQDMERAGDAISDKARQSK